MSAPVDLPHWGTDSSVAILSPSRQVAQSPEIVVQDHVGRQGVSSRQITIRRLPATHAASDDHARQQNRAAAHSEESQSRQGHGQRDGEDSTSVDQARNREGTTDWQDPGQEDTSGTGGRHPTRPASAASPSRLEEGLADRRGSCTRYSARSYDHDDLLTPHRHRRRESDHTAQSGDFQTGCLAGGTAVQQWSSFCY